MQIMKPSPIALGFGLVAWAVAVQAQTSALPLAAAALAPTNAAAAVFRSADTNSDGWVSRAEFGGYVGKSTFEKLDANKNGAITLEEWRAVDYSPDAKMHFDALDKDRNGRISYPEFSNASDWGSALNDSFKALDRDRDSNLAPGELTGRPMFRLLSVDF